VNAENIVPPPDVSENMPDADELDHREAEAVRAKSRQEPAASGDSEAENDQLNRNFAAQLPGTRTGARSPWLAAGFLGLCAVALIFIFTHDRKRLSQATEKPPTFETVAGRTKVALPAPSAPPDIQESPEVKFEAEPPSPTREELEQRKEAEQKRKQAEALRVARLKSAIIVMGNSAGLLPAGAMSQASLGAEHGESSDTSAPASDSDAEESQEWVQGEARQVMQAPSQGALELEASVPPTGASAQQARPAQTADANERFFAEKSGRTSNTVRANKLHNLGYLILEGKLLDAVLESAINSDLPGRLRAVLRNDIYGEQGRIVLLPAGTRLIGQYNSAVRKGQARVFVIWQRAIRPDGVEILLDSFGTDALGRAGIAGEVDNHYREIFAVSAMLSIIGAGASNAGVGASDQPNSESNYRSEIQRSFSQTAQQLLSPYAQMPPTIHVPQGQRINVFVNRDLDFTSIYAAPASIKQPSYVLLR
jgi:type IV secretory pathway VirB10-like protein